MKNQHLTGLAGKIAILALMTLAGGVARGQVRYVHPLGAVFNPRGGVKGKRTLNGVLRMDHVR